MCEDMGSDNGYNNIIFEKNIKFSNYCDFNKIINNYNNNVFKKENIYNSIKKYCYKYIINSIFDISKIISLKKFNSINNGV
jgi:hypothetical protein